MIRKGKFIVPVLSKAMAFNFDKVSKWIVPFTITPILLIGAKGIKGVSCPSKYYGLASAARPVIGVLESGSEIRCIIEDTKGGLCCEPGEYDKVEENIRWFIDNAGSEELKAMGARSRENLEKNLTRNVSVQKYAEEILKL